MTGIYEYFRTMFLENEFAQGGLVLSLLTALMYQLRAVPGIVWNFLVRYGTVSAVFHKGGSEFDNAVRYLINAHGKARFGPFINVDLGRNGPDTGDPDETPLLSVRVPAGHRYHRKGLSIVRVQMSSRALENANSELAVTYSVGIDVAGFRKKRVLESILNDPALKGPKRPNLYNYSQHYWECLGQLPVRSMGTVVCKSKDQLISSVGEFTKSREWYKSLGIPYRLGILLEGPPGTGKSSIALALANYMEKDLYTLSFSGLTGNSLKSAMSGNNKLVLIEDIDVAVDTAGNRNKKTKEGKSVSLCSLADILNAIDGVTSGCGTVLIMTTNQADTLDPALLRPGRIDLKCHLGYLDQELFEQLTVMYYGCKIPLTVSENSKLTAAAVQGIFLKHKKDQGEFQKEIASLL